VSEGAEVANKKQKKTATRNPKAHPKGPAGKRHPMAKKAAKPSKSRKKGASRPAPRHAKAEKASKAKGKKGKAPTGPTAGFAKPRAPKDTIRRPSDSEELKQKLGALAQATNQVKNLKRTLHKSFWDIGQILKDIEDRRLYEVKGYGSFEAFVERELDLGKQLSLRIVRIAQTFLREAALRVGLEKAVAALEVLEGDEEATPPPPATTTTSSGVRSPIPPHKQ
jgi:hypothetical protein